MYQSITKLIIKTAKDLGKDPLLVEKVIMSQFLFVKNQFHTPSFPVVRLEDLGKFIITPSSLQHYFKVLRRLSSNKPNSLLYKKALSDIANIRYPTQVHHLSRKYKLRFGSWHYK